MSHKIEQLKIKMPLVNWEKMKNNEFINYEWIEYIYDEARIKELALGYDLNDERNPPVMYEMDGYYDFGLIEIVSMESDEVKVIKEADFWVIADR